MPVSSQSSMRSLISFLALNRCRRKTKERVKNGSRQLYTGHLYEVWTRLNLLSLAEQVQPSHSGLIVVVTVIGTLKRSAVLKYPFGIRGSGFFGPIASCELTQLRKCKQE